MLERKLDANCTTNYAVVITRRQRRAAPALSGSMRIDRRRAVAFRQRLLESDGIDATVDALEAALHEMWRPRRLQPAVHFALAAFDRAPSTTSVAAVTDAIGLSAKRFIERFKSEVGLTPKRYCRVRRFQRAVALSSRGRHVDWTRVDSKAHQGTARRIAAARARSHLYEAAACSLIADAQAMVEASRLDDNHH